MLEVTFPPTQTHGWPPFCSWPQGGSSGVIIALQMAYIRAVAFDLSDVRCTAGGRRPMTIFRMGGDENSANVRKFEAANATTW